MPREGGREGGGEGGRGGESEGEKESERQRERERESRERERGRDRHGNTHTRAHTPAARTAGSPVAASAPAITPTPPPTPVCRMNTRSHSPLAPQRGTCHPHQPGRLRFPTPTFTHAHAPIHPRVDNGVAPINPCGRRGVRNCNSPSPLPTPAGPAPVSGPARPA